MNRERERYASVHIHMYIYIYTWQRPKNIGLVIGQGGLFATRLVTESGGLATKPPCDKHIEDCSAPHRGPRQGSNKGGDRDKSLFRATPIYIYTYTCACISTCVHLCAHILFVALFKLLGPLLRGGSTTPSTLSFSGFKVVYRYLVWTRSKSDPPWLDYL